MLFTISAYLSLAICLFGLIYRIGRWFRLQIGATSDSPNPGQRLGSAAAAGLDLIFSRRLGSVLLALGKDVVLQQHLFRQDWRRWLMHMSLFYGVILLVFLHALDDQITRALFPDYASTLNPYLFLRNLLGALVLTGAGIAVIRRRAIRALKRFSAPSDHLALFLLALVVVSGILLESTQIISPSIFDQMVIDYLGDDDPELVEPLKAYWAAEYAVAFSPPVRETDASLLADGKNVHREFCAECHSPPQSAFVSYAVARAIKPMAGFIDRQHLDLYLWYLHFLASFAALAYLPFSKFFHLISTPINLMVRAAGNTSTNTPANRLTRRAMGLDACTHCGVCSQHCSVKPVFQVIDNHTILPSEKLGAAEKAATGRQRPVEAVELAEGSHICTLCGRCTIWCPSGIDLQDLWQASLKDLGCNGYSDPHSWIRTRSIARWAEEARQRRSDAEPPPPVRLADSPDSFWACVQCTTCTAVCPVVAASDDPQRDLDMTPQQIMNLLRMQLKELALGCRMVWDCVTCYKCQEHCPQGVKVADVLYELRNEACRRLKPTGPIMSNAAKKVPEPEE